MKRLTGLTLSSIIFENNTTEVKGPKCTSESDELDVHQAAPGNHKVLDMLFILETFLKMFPRQFLLEVLLKIRLICKQQ